MRFAASVATPPSSLSIFPGLVRLVTNTGHHFHGRIRMKYLCLIYDDEASWATRSQQENDHVSGEYTAYTSDIQRSNHFVAGAGLMPTSAASTVRIRNGKLVTTDGPFAETKEQLGGFYLIEAADLNEAIQVASRIPAARSGSIEVRPINKMG